MTDKKPTLDYAKPHERSGLAWPVFLGIFQFAWVVFFMIGFAGESGPKHVVRDSLSFLLVATPSLAATIVSFLAGLHHAFRARRSESMAICFVVCGISAIVAGRVILEWINTVVRDPHGVWVPL